MRPKLNTCPSRLSSAWFSILLTCQPRAADLASGEYALLDLRQIYAGFFSLALTAAAESDFILAFSESSPEGRFTFARINMHAVIEYLLAPVRMTCSPLSPIPPAMS